MRSSGRSLSCLRADTGIEQRGRHPCSMANSATFNRVVHRVNRAAQVQAADHDQAALDALLEQGAAQRTKTPPGPRRCRSCARRRPAAGPRTRAHGDHGRRPVPWPANTGSARRSGRSRRNGAGAGRLRILTPDPGPSVTSIRIKPGILVQPAGTDRPYLPGRQRVAADVVFALQFRRDDELLHAIVAQRVAEMRIAELRRPDALLLLLDAASALQGQPDAPFQVLFGDRACRDRDTGASAGR